MMMSKFFFKIGQGLEFGLSENDSRCCRWESSLQSQKGSILCHYTADAQAVRKYLAVSSLSPSTPRMSPPAWSQSARVSPRQRGMSTNTTYSLLPLSPAFNNTLSSPTAFFYCFDVVIKSNQIVERLREKCPTPNYVGIFFYLKKPPSESQGAEIRQAALSRSFCDNSLLF